MMRSLKRGTRVYTEEVGVFSDLSVGEISQCKHGSLTSRQEAGKGSGNGAGNRMYGH